ncbi:hypothetical protein EGW08_012304 [Elysia chlorotica]|uniref:Uncharacterized protein n=1 Tax=Elysia chlorotica TaxID=188477 RepID=A0A3S1A0Y1_ELYCH|nr:hypothetical protein EGW08_012304 [Elysia chlorotica]
MFHAGGHKGATRGRSSGFSRHYPGLLSHHDWKQPLRCGILFCTFSCILFVIGVILTWLGSRRVHDVFGESVPITGPILLSVGGLMLLLAFRQFYIARERQIAAKKALATKDAVKLANAALDNEEDDPEMSGLQDGHVKFKDYDENDPYSKSRHLLSDGYYDHAKTGASMDDPSGMGGHGMVCAPYVWPPISINSPYYSMALMANAANYAYAPLTAYNLSSANLDLVSIPVASTLPVVSPLAANLDGSLPSGPTTLSEGPAAGGISPVSPGTSHHQCQYNSGTLSNGTSASQPDNGGTAVLQTSSTTLQTQSAAASPEAAVIAPSSAAEDIEPIPDSHKIFPADYLFSHQRTGSGRMRKEDNSGTSANDGISNLPKQTTVMMLRTLELQETI